MLFCSIVVNVGDKTGEKDPETGRSRVRQRKNTSERGVQGIHVGISSKRRGWLCYLPSINSTVVSNDLFFDKQFYSKSFRHADRARFTGGIPLQPHLQAITDGDQVEVVGTSYIIDQREEDYSDDCEEGLPIQNFGSLSLNCESNDALMDDAIEPILPNDPDDAVYFDVEYPGYEAKMIPQPDDTDLLTGDWWSWEKPAKMVKQTRRAWIPKLCTMGWNHRWAERIPPNAVTGVSTGAKITKNPGYESS